jgi:hypothetical protein
MLRPRIITTIPGTSFDLGHWRDLEDVRGTCGHLILASFLFSD